MVFIHTIHQPITTTKILPRKGDRVLIDGLKGAKEHNGKYGSVQGVSSYADQRYKITLERGKKDLGVRLANLTVCSSDISGEKLSSSKSLHVLIPCHVASDRRVVTFMRCARSVGSQFDAYLQRKTDYSVFVGLSGPEEYRAKTFQYLSELAQRSGCRWYLQDDQIEARPQLEHLRSLLLRGSLPVDSNALLSFVDNDDMCHPLRFHILLDAYGNMPFDDDDGYTLGMPCKLILNPTITPEEGQLENFVDPKRIQDFDYWRRNSFARRKVQLATNETADELDCEEYFDYVVPSSVLKKFFDLNPPEVASNKFCDLRLLAVFSHLCPLAVGDTMMPGMWLLAHYKIPMDEKRAAFDRHGERDVENLVQSVDQASFQEEELAATDLELAKRFPKLSPGQIAMCRAHIESIIISFVGWNADKLERARIEKVFELNRSHGPGFGEALWQECLSAMLALFDNETLEASKGAWDTFQVDEDDFVDFVF